MKSIQLVLAILLLKLEVSSSKYLLPDEFFFHADNIPLSLYKSFLCNSFRGPEEAETRQRTEQYRGKNPMATSAVQIADKYIAFDPDYLEFQREVNGGNHLEEIVGEISGEDSCVGCPANFQSTDDLTIAALSHILPQGLSDAETDRAVEGMMVLGNANLGKDDLADIFNKYVKGISNSNKKSTCPAALTFVQILRSCHARIPLSERWMKPICADFKSTIASKLSGIYRENSGNITTNLFTQKQNTSSDPIQPNARPKPPTPTTQITTTLPTPTSTKPTKTTTFTTTTPATTTTTLATTTTTTLATTTTTTLATTTTTTPTTTTTTTSTTSTTPVATVKCGVGDNSSLVTSNIQGATTCNIYPWMVSLLVDGYAKCGAVILDATHLLTAAYCTSDINSLKATVGNYNDSLAEDTEQIFDIDLASGIFIHPDFSYVEQKNDIAVIRLSSPIDLTKSCAKPICLDSTTPVTPEQSCQTAGWPTDVLKTVSVSVYPGTQCQQVFGEVPTDPSNQLCSAKPSEDPSTCPYSSGGPLFCLNTLTNTWRLVGVTSYNNDCQSSGLAVVYATISAYYTWIQQQLTT